MARRPKWSLNCIQEKVTIFPETVEGTILSLQEVPKDAWIETNDYEILVYWHRDMTDKEYEKEKKKRAKRKQKATEAEYEQYLVLRAKYGSDT